MKTGSFSLALSMTTLALTACPPSEPQPDAGPFAGTLHIDQILAHDGIDRRFHLFEADGHQTSPRPLVVVLHGGGADIDAFIGQTGGAAPLAGVWLDLADSEGFHVVVPQGESTSGGAHWNDCRGDCTHCGELDDAGFLLALVDEVSQRVSVDPARIFVSGESNGGFMTLRLATEHPDVFAAFGVTVALMPADNSCSLPATPVPVAFFLGTEDGTSVYEGGPAALEASGTMLSADESISIWTDLGQCDAPPETTDIPDGPEDDDSTVVRVRHQCPATDTQVLLYRVDGGGHVVPSIAEPVSAFWESLVGKQNHDIETAAEQWAFFQEHTRSTE